MPLADGLKGFLIGGRTNIAGTAQSPDVDQEELRMIFASLLNPGIGINNLTGGANASAFNVRQDTGSNMQVRVGSASPKRDICFLRGGIAGQGMYACRIDDPNGYVAVTVPTTDPTFPAKYSVFLYVNDAAYGGDAARATFGLACLRGTPAASPTAPNPLSTWSASARLWTFQLAANATAVTNAILDAGTRDVGVGGISSNALNFQAGQFQVGGFGQLQLLSVDGSLIPAGTLPATALPTSMPRGLVAQASTTTATSGITGTTDLTGLSCTWTADSTRRYKTTLMIHPSGDNNGAYGQVWIRDGSNNVKATTGFVVPFLASNVVGHLTLFALETGLSGSQTRKGTMFRQSGVGNLNAYADAGFIARIFVEDVGV